jgi:hypothetical protein
MMRNSQSLRVNKLDSEVQDLRAQVQAQAREQSDKKPSTVLGSAAKRIEVGPLSEVAKHLLG